MPIQANVQYRAIPDIEDVTPVNGSISSITKRSRKWIRIVCLVFAFVVIPVCFVFFLRYRYNAFRRDVRIQIFQTSINRSDEMVLLSSQTLAARGFNIGSLKFGNTLCEVKEEREHLCSPPKGRLSKIDVDSSQTFQKIIGFGGAFTEASAINFFKLPKAVQDKFIKLYFGRDGLGYTLGRVHINSCDFSPKSYSFDEVEGDFDLKYFDTDVTHDQAQMIPFIRLAMEAIASTSQSLHLLASPWSPPAWMKASDDKHKASMTGSALPNGLIDTVKIKTAWARYISKFVEAYREKGIPIWAITPQNEPEFPAPWEACAYTADFERDFINGFLGPVIKAEHPSTLILAFDHNKDHLLHWAEVTMSGGDSQYVDGMAFHWYSGTADRMMDGTYGYNAINDTHHQFPDKILLASEGCSCPDVELGSILRAERLAHDIMFDLLNWAHGWIDWNLLVDSKGGPNHLDNMCDAPIVAKPDFSDIVLQPKYHYFGHFSKFLQPNSVRIASSVVGSFQYEEMDPNVRYGFELALFPCEQSVRQMWKLHYANNTISLFTPAIVTDYPNNPPIYLCFGVGNVDRPYLKLAPCVGSTPQLPLLHFSFRPSGQLVERKSQRCISVVGGSSDAGALLELADCDASSASQRFNYESVTGEMVHHSSGMCITAGWPFLTAAAFVSADKMKTIVVVMNEASSGTDILLSDKVNGDMWFGINERSIQTVVY